MKKNNYLKSCKTLKCLVSIFLVLTLLFVVSCGNNNSSNDKTSSKETEATLETDANGEPVIAKTLRGGDLVESVDFASLDKLIPKMEDIDKAGVEDKMWHDLVANTKYINLPKEYENNFAVKKYLAIDYIHESRINGMNSIPYETKLKGVKEFLLKKIYISQGY